MSASSLSGGSIRILWDAATSAEVTISGPGTEVFTVNGGAITFPYTLSASTTFDTNNSGAYDVSVKHHGYEVAGTPDGTRTCELSFGQQVTFAPTPDGTPHDKVLAHLSATYARRAWLDPRLYGAVCDGVTDDTAALQAAVNAGDVLLPPLSIKITGTITISTDGRAIRGTGPKSSIIIANGDMTSFRFAAGIEEPSLSNFKIQNTTFSGTRTTYDVEAINPYKPIIDSVEIALSGSGAPSLAKGGIRMYKDAGAAGADRSFMPQITNLWLRNGVLDVDEVTDGKVENSFIWSTYTGAAGAVQLTQSGNWTFENVDLVPPQGDGAGYLLDQINLLTIVGGLMDGSYDEIMTGHGLKSIGYVRGLTVQGVKFYNLGRSGIKMTDVRRSTFIGNVFHNCNKADNAYHDIDVASAQANIFLGNSHAILASRTNKSKMYFEDASSFDNVYDGNVMESGGNQYESPNSVKVNVGSTLGPLNRPHTAFPFTALRALSADATIVKEDVFNEFSWHASGTITVTLPSASSLHAGNKVPILNTGTGLVTLATVSSQTIDGAVTSIALAPGRSVTLQADGAGGWRMSDAKSLSQAIASPPMSTFLSLSANAWPAANRAVFQRFSLPEARAYRYLNMRLDTSSGNYQVGIVRLTGAGLTSYTRVMDSGVITAPTAGDLHVDLGSTLLPAGDYALFLWFDNTTAQTRVATNSGVPSMRQTAEVSSLTGGVPASGSLTWGSDRFLSGVNLEAA